MKYFAGLDVSLDETAMCIMDENGAILREGSVPTEPGAIVDFLSASMLTFSRIGLEAGNLSAWLYHSMSGLGLPVICIETHHAKAALQAQKVKTDRNDACGLAHIMRTGWFKAVHVKSDESQRQRVLLGNRRCLLSKRLEIENRIRGTLKVWSVPENSKPASGS